MDVCIGGPVVDVFACTLGGECTVNQHAIPGLKVCRKCDDRTAVATATTSAVAPIAVVIPCHNYARYLPECLNSVLRQTNPPVEVVVVDDSSTDDPFSVVERYAAAGVGYVRVDVANVHAARGAGFRATSAEWVCFLDADDTVDQNYFQEAIARISPGIGMIFTDVEQMGSAHGSIRYEIEDITARNFIHCGAVTRRVALESSGVFDVALSTDVCEDWWVWRRLASAGWKAVKSPAMYRYRRHHGSRSSMLSTLPYYTLADLQREEITIAIPLSGRRQWWPRVAAWLERQTWPPNQTRILLVDTSGDDTFGSEVREWLAGCRYRSTHYISLSVAKPGLADADRRIEEVYRGVQRAMPRIYNCVRKEITTPYTLIVEDDIEPPPDVVERLLRSFSDDVASVSAVYRSRYQDAFVAWPLGPGLPASFTEAGTGVQQVGGNGFGCVMLRTSVLRDAVFHHGGLRGDFDPNFYAELAPGWRALLDWSVRCRHADLE